MIPADTSPHLHTAECNLLWRLRQECAKEQSLFRQFIYKECEYWYIAATQCFHEERLYRRATNPKFTKRLLEHKRLPEERYTPALKKLKAEGKLQFDDRKDGCCKIWLSIIFFGLHQAILFLFWKKTYNRYFNKLSKYIIIHQQNNEYTGILK